MKHIITAVAASLIACSSAEAAPLLLDFEGVGDYNFVGDYYRAQGVVFSDDALAAVDVAGGGLSEFSGEPSPHTIASFVGPGLGYLNVASGFADSFSFYYSSSITNTVTLYSGISGAGSALASIALVKQYDRGCAVDTYCNWTKTTVVFAGTARSVTFGDTGGQVGYDDMVFGRMLSSVPEPKTWMMLLAGFGALGIQRRQRRSRAIVES